MAVTLGVIANLPSDLEVPLQRLGQQEMSGALLAQNSGRVAVQPRARGASRRSIVASVDSFGRPTSRRVHTRAHTGVPMSIASVPVQVVRELLEAGHSYLDVRTPDEFATGHIAGAVNIPYMFKHNQGLLKNNDFVSDVLKHFSIDDELVVGCLRGKRSLLAATELQAAHFTNVTDCGGGFHAWMQSGLPYEKGCVRALTHTF